MHAVTLPSQKIADTIDVLNQLFAQYDHCMKNTKHKYKDLMKVYKALMKKKLTEIEREREKYYLKYHHCVG